jgi:cytochrome c oxidase subunit 4
MTHDIEHGVSNGTFVAVWAALLALTGLLVGVSQLGADVAVWAMLLVTPLKAGLVFYYFMHLKYEGLLLKAMVFVALATLVVFIGLLFLDISFR